MELPGGPERNGHLVPYVVGPAARLHIPSHLSVRDSSCLFHVYLLVPGPSRAVPATDAVAGFTPDLSGHYVMRGQAVAPCEYACSSHYPSFARISCATGAHWPRSEVRSLAVALARALGALMSSVLAASIRVERGAGHSGLTRCQQSHVRGEV